MEHGHKLVLLGIATAYWVATAYWTLDLPACYVRIVFPDLQEGSGRTLGCTLRSVVSEACGFVRTGSTLTSQNSLIHASNAC